MSKKVQILEKAIEIIKTEREGIRYSELVRRLHKQFPDFAVNTIHGTIWDMDKSRSQEVYKAARGLFRSTLYQEEKVGESLLPVSTEIANKTEIKEVDFYQSFANWLEGEGECTHAIQLGGSKFGKKWGTPDVIGIWKSNRTDILQVLEIISAEIKTDTTELVTAFGQACAYKLFSHKSYLVIPRQSLKEETERVVALCLIFGIGLVLFDKNNVNDPDWEIKVSPIKHEPDIFYANEKMEILEKDTDLFRA